MDLLVNALDTLASTAFDLLVLAGAGQARLEALVVGLVCGAVASLAFSRAAPWAVLSRCLASLPTHLLEIWIYRRLPRVVLLAELRLLAASLRLLVRLLPPLAISALVVAPLLVQSHYRFGLLPAQPGQPLLVTVEVDETRVDVRDGHFSLVWLQGEGQVLGPVRQPVAGLVTWRLTPQTPGACRQSLEVDAWQGELPLQVGAAGGSLAPSRLRRALPRLLHPRGEPLEPISPAISATAAYPSAPTVWMLWLCLGSAIGASLAGLALRRRSRPATS